MLKVRARVTNGRLVLDEPTDLPEGAEVELTLVDDQPWDLTSEQRVELKARIAGADRGELVPRPRSSLASARADTMKPLKGYGKDASRADGGTIRSRTEGGGGEEHRRRS